jgi:hypothetical protein
MRWLTLPNQKQNKYKNKKVSVNGKVFDSKKEAKRYLELIKLEQTGLIKDLETQKKFLLLDSFKKNGKTYKQISYYADFVYFDIYEKKTIVEDVKASKYFKTDVYKIKKKLFEFIYPNLTIKEIY